MGVFAPNIEYRVAPDVDWIELCAVHKGGAFGTDFRMLVDGDGLPGIRKAVLDAIADFAREYAKLPDYVLKRIGEIDHSLEHEVIVGKPERK